MRRLGFFLAVFSVGLVVFLISTGQLSKLFTGGSGDGAPLPTVQGDSDGPTTFTFHYEDTKTGRLIFSFRGEIDDLAGIQVNLPTIKEHEWTMQRAVMEIPIAASKNRVAQIFEIRADDVSYYPRPPRTKTSNAVASRLATIDAERGLPSIIDSSPKELPGGIARTSSRSTAPSSIVPSEAGSTRAATSPLSTR